MDIEKFEKENKGKYTGFKQVLFEFMDGSYSEEDNQVTIERFCKEYLKSALEAAIQEGHQLLELDPFPWEWMVDMGQLLNSQINQYVGHLNLNEEEIESGKDIKIWTKCVIEAIEAEGKRIGKL